MLKDWAREAYLQRNFNCAESVLWAANRAYGLGLPAEGQKLIGGFGGGLACGSTCGALCGAMAVLGFLRMGENAHATPGFREDCAALSAAFRARLGALDCRELTPKYKREDGTRCLETVLLACEVLEEQLQKAGALEPQPGPGIRLLTTRLVLRDHCWGDLETHHALFSHPVAMCYLPDIMTHSLEESRANLRAAIREIDAPRRRLVFLRLELRDTGEHVGEAGYTVTEETPAGKLAGMGYFLRPGFWGQGYCPEAVEALLGYAFTQGGVYRMSCGCLKENTRSERVMVKCGMVKEAERQAAQWHDGAFKDRLEYRLLREEWKP